MDTRTALKENTTLRSGEGFTFVIRNEIARGASCIVYDAIYRIGCDEKPVRLKECCPFCLGIKRMKTGELIPDAGDTDAFIKAKERMQRAFHEGNGLFVTEGLTNAMSNMLHCFEANNTVYIPSVYLEGEPLSFTTFSSLQDCIRIVRSVAMVVGRIHRAGYLYLDVKPSNVFVITDASGKGATELVQLFDFDSLVKLEDLKQPDAGDLRLSYTKGFAALEHQLGQIFRIGPWTDVYSAGALLFYLIFGRPPRAADCEQEAAYEFENSKYGDVRYQDRLFQKLTAFFHRTLSNYRFDRYQTMGETVEKLAELVRLSDTMIPYVISTAVLPERYFIGREEEYRQLREWVSGEENGQCLFLTGMGGIGKSSLARSFLTGERDRFDTVLYLYFEDSVQKLILDDERLQINTVEQEPEEKAEDYFIRKLRKLKILLAGKRAILVIDNFCGEITGDFLRILDVGWKVLVLSRALPPSGNAAHIPLKAIRERACLHRLFEYHIGVRLEEKDRGYLDRLIEEVEGHTLALVLIARQIRKSRMTLAEAQRLTAENGFSRIAREKVRFEKDHTTWLEKVRDIISAVFFYHGKEPEKQRILRAVSLFGPSGPDVRMFREMLELSSLDCMNELEEESWLMMSGDRVCMHPVIRESVALWEWEAPYLEDARRIMKYLYTELKPEADRAEYPLSYVMKELVQTAEPVLRSCENVEPLRQSAEWMELMANTLLAMPVDRENFIIRYVQELVAEPDSKNGYRSMRLYHKLLSVYLERYETGEAWALLKNIRTFIRRYDHYVKAQYYDMLADYYDTILDGQYAAEEEKENLTMLLRAIDQAIFHMTLARGGHKKSLLAEYTLNKANVLIRSMPEKAGEIRRLLAKARKWADENTQIFSKLHWEYRMSYAWYYTLSEPDMKRAEFYCRTAEKLVPLTCATELEYIDIIIIPHANMMAEFADLEKSAEILREGIRICEKYPDIVPYIRKRADLYEYLLEVYFYAENKEGCRELIRQMEKESERLRELGIICRIPEQVRGFAREANGRR